jgi:hypothetical protein
MVKGSVVLLDDSFPHGTVRGYEGGCKGGHCPAAIACRDVKRRYGSDLDFRRLIDAGVSLEEIVEFDRAAAERDAEVERRRRRGLPDPAPMTVESSDAAEARRPKQSHPAVGPAPVGDGQTRAEVMAAAEVMEHELVAENEALEAEREVLTDEQEETGVLVVTITPDISGMRPRKWAVRKVWMAIAPDGSVHGPFEDQQQGLTFVSAQFPIPLSTLALDDNPAAAGRSRRPWTDDDTARAKDLWTAGHSDSEIGRQMGRDQATVGRRLRRLGFGMNPARRGKSPQ